MDNQANEKEKDETYVDHEWEFWIDLPEEMTPEQEWNETIEALLELTR